MVPLLLLALVAQVHAACPSTPEQIRSTAELTVQAWREWNWEDFSKYQAETSENLRCVSSVVPLRDVARIHLVQALAAAYANDEAAARRAFLGLLRVESTWTPADELAASGSLLRRAWDAAKNGEPGLDVWFAEGSWTVDGIPRATRVPVERGTLIQRMDGEKVLGTWYLDGNGIPMELMHYVSLGAPAPEPAATPKKSGRRR